MLVLSIISHNNSFDILNLITNNLSNLDRRFIKIVVRVNLREQTKNYEIVEKLIKKADFKVVFNQNTFGFGKNHNLTFKEFATPGDIFIVCNPDIKLFSADLFEAIIEAGKKDNIICPRILENNFEEADFRRDDISLLILAVRVFSKKFGITKNNLKWVPSVFKCFPYKIYEKLGGYDEEIFMYYEDYDICMRAASIGIKLNVLEAVFLVHPSTRKSRRNLKLLFSHLKSFIFVLRKKRRGIYS